ncbi:sucrose-6-phosphate hydrolase [Bifidobacterium sp. SMB2]|uniref:Sucrose-6-phosphate hydrolase n=1 Tax=Bifidobacterium saimiriisciurei TaxID=2661627 RepID=A0ABX0C9E5_9BIFI|nr:MULTISPECIES: sucrose-6-phosphate hydrolase [Bifidobacterium]NEG95924.1 sucrose-6-phosphate hydrolase [Bifidobacterium sp. SMB2]NEH11771.1 sucrose-6-phosphate hydrolase [Bifidobacterium saimiriisciurei]
MTNSINNEFVSHASALDRAQAGVADLARSRNDRWYPRFHIASDGGWINSPNGFCFFRGRWHVFYQLNPFDTQWGTMHCGHVSSEDLVTWRREPIALAPSLEADRDGIYSGSAVVGDDGRLWLFYTGHRWANGVDPSGGNFEVQCAAVSDDGVHFEKIGMVIDNVDGFNHFRDPKVWKQDGLWYMVFGMSTKNRRGQVLLYVSEDMLIWHFHSILYRHPNPGVFMLESLDFFPLSDKEGNEHWVLSFSALGERPNGFANRNPHTASYVIGSWAPGEEFAPRTEFRMWDWGHNFYAPQTVRADDGRTLQYGWMSPFTPARPNQGDGWCGQLSIPREISLDSYGCIRINPARELTRLRTDTIDFGAVHLDANETTTVMADCDAVEIEMEIDINESTAEFGGLKVHSTKDNAHSSVFYDAQTHRILIDRHANARGDRGYRAAPFTSNTLKLRVFVDRASIEVFINDGEQAMSSYSFPSEGPRAIELSAESGTLEIPTLRVHHLSPIGL